MKLLLSLLMIFGLTSACSSNGASSKKAKTYILGEDKPKELVGKVELKTLPSFLLGGYHTLTKESETHKNIPPIWKKLMSDLNFLSKAKKSGEFWGVYYHYQFSKERKFEVLAAIELHKEESLKNIHYYQVPQSTYLVFTYQGKMTGFQKAYEYIYSKWLPLNRFRPNYEYNLEFYNHNYKGDQDSSLLYIYIPLKK